MSNVMFLTVAFFTLVLHAHVESTATVSQTPVVRKINQWDPSWKEITFSWFWFSCTSVKNFSMTALPLMRSTNSLQVDLVFILRSLDSQLEALG